MECVSTNYCCLTESVLYSSVCAFGFARSYIQPAGLVRGPDLWPSFSCVMSYFTSISDADGDDFAVRLLMPACFVVSFDVLCLSLSLELPFATRPGVHETDAVVHNIFPLT